LRAILHETLRQVLILETTSDILILGGGIAGLSAALCAARLGRKTHVLTGNVLGGHLLSIESVEGYPGFQEGVPGYDLCPITQAQAAEAGAEFAMSEATSISHDDGTWRVESPSGRYSAHAVIIATGTQLKSLGVPGEDNLRGSGVSHCASCDAPLLSARPVVVAGGGDSAAQEALVLAAHAASVLIVHHGDSLSAQQSFCDRIALQSNITLRPNSEIVEILGDAAVTGVRVRDLVAGTDEDVEAQGVFVYIGIDPNTALLRGVVELSDTGHIVTGADFSAGVAGAYAAGTVRAGAVARAAAAAGEGATAAIAAHRYLMQLDG
jgi:thioredoxin reductase (NADPH)